MDLLPVERKVRSSCYGKFKVIQKGHLSLSMTLLYEDHDTLALIFRYCVSHLSIRELQQEMFLSRTVVLEEQGWHPHCIWVRNPHTRSLAKEQAVGETVNILNQYQRWELFIIQLLVEHILHVLDPFGVQERGDFHYMILHFVFQDYSCTRNTSWPHPDKIFVTHQHKRLLNSVKN